MKTEELALRLATADDAAAIRALVNEAYRPLAEMGLNFTGTYQDEATTRERMRDRDVWLWYRGSELAGTITLDARVRENFAPHLYVNQMAVRPGLQRLGLGKRLLELADAEACRRGLDRVRLDTAVPARHLVRFYAARGFVEIARTRWAGKTYESVVLETRL